MCMKQSIINALKTCFWFCKKSRDKKKFQLIVLLNRSLGLDSRHILLLGRHVDPLLPARSRALEVRDLCLYPADSPCVVSMEWCVPRCGRNFGVMSMNFRYVCFFHRVLPFVAAIRIQAMVVRRLLMDMEHQGLARPVRLCRLDHLCARACRVVQLHPLICRVIKEYICYIYCT